MPNYFPDPRPNEILYSLLVRFHYHTFSTSQKQTLEECFGNRSIRLSVDFQSHINDFADQAGHFFLLLPMR